MLNKNHILLVSSPFKIPVGGFLREYWVLPLIAKKLYELGYELKVLVPTTSILIFEKYLNNSIDYSFSKETLLMNLENNFKELIRRSNYTLDVILPSIDVIKEVVRPFSRNTGIISNLIPKNILRHISFLFNIVNEFNTFKSLKDLNKLKNNILLVYITHETPECLFLGAKVVSISGAKSALLIHHIEPYHVGYYIYKTPIQNSHLVTRIADIALHNIVMKYLCTLKVSIVNSVTPEILLYRRLLNKTGISLVHLLNPPNALRQELQNNYKLFCRENDEITFLYFGRISFEKGISDLLAAWKIIQKNIPNAKLKIIGYIRNNGVKEFIRKYISSHGLKNISFLGVQPYERVIEEAMRSHILLYPSYIDGFSFTVLESVAMGLIVIAYSIPAISFYYNEVPSVFTVKPGKLREFALTAIEVAKNYEKICMDKIEYKKHYIEEFLKKYSSWNAVADSEIQGLLKAINKIKNS